MDRCLLDTNTLSDVMLPPGRRLATIESNLRIYLRAHGRLTFLEITCYEILRGLRKKRAVAQLQRFGEFCRHCEQLAVSFEVLDKAATLWADGQRQGTIVDDGDLMIVATALVHQLTLVTSNTRHFSWINGLTLLDWRNS